MLDFSRLVTIKEEFTLPSKGLIYGVADFNPVVTIRSMTNSEDLQLSGYTDFEYRKISEIIESCIEEKLPVHVYDMCLGDYIFLLHKLRIVSYGSDYSVAISCPNCHAIVNATTNLDDIEVNEFDEKEIKELRDIELPITKYRIKLGFQTPRILDQIKEKAKELKKKKKTQGVNYEILYEIMSYISKVDGESIDDETLEQFVLKLPSKDAKYIQQKGKELNGKVGLNTSEIIAKCPECGYEVLTTFQYRSEFFNPKIH